jgi:hypothetical protein
VVCCQAVLLQLLLLSRQCRFVMAVTAGRGHRGRRWPPACSCIESCSVGVTTWQYLAPPGDGCREAALSSYLSQKFQRALSRSLCSAAAGYAEPSAAQQYVSHLLLQTASQVAGLAGQQHQQLSAAAQRADVQLQVRTTTVRDPEGPVMLQSCCPAAVEAR